MRKLAPTYKQKKLIKERGYDPQAFLVAEENEQFLIIIRKNTEEKIALKK